MEFDIPTERSEEFKIYFAKKLTEATGKIYESEDIFIYKKYGSLCHPESSDKFKYIFADLLFDKYEKRTITDIEYVYGDVSFVGSSIESLGSLTHIKGCFTSSYTLKDLGNLNTIGGNANFTNSCIKDLGDLKTIGGYADFSFSDIERLKGLKSIGGYANFTNSFVKDLGDLKIIGGDAIFNNSLVNDLKNLEYVGRNFIVFLNENLESLGKLKYIGGDLEANDRLESLSNLEYLGGNLTIKFLKSNIYYHGVGIEDLGKLKVVEGGMDLSNCKNLSSLNDLIYVGDFLNLAHTQVKTLGNVEYIGGDLYLDKSNVTDLGNLQYVGGEIYLNDSQKELFKDRIKIMDGRFYLINNSNYVNPLLTGEGNYKENFEKILKEEKDFYL